MQRKLFWSNLQVLFCGNWNENIDVLYKESLNYALVSQYQGAVIKQIFLDLQQFHLGKVYIELTESRGISQPILKQRADTKVWKTQTLLWGKVWLIKTWKPEKFSLSFLPDLAPSGVSPSLTSSPQPSWGSLGSRSHLLGVHNSTGAECSQTPPVHAATGIPQKGAEF